MVVTREVARDDLIRDGEEAAVGAIGALDSRFLADARDPLVGASRGISGFPCAPAFEAAWINIVAPPEERAKQRDLEIR
jgi:hypothetical protein